MAQDERDWTAVQALLPDQIIEDISPKDLRDALASMQGYGSLLLASPPAVFAGPTSPTPVVITEFDTVSAKSVDVNSSGTTASAAAGTITVGSTGVYRVEFHLVLLVSLIGASLVMEVFRQGVATGLRTHSFASTSEFFHSASCILQLTSGDVIDLRVSEPSTGKAVSITFSALGLCLHRVG